MSEAKGTWTERYPVRVRMPPLPGLVPGAQRYSSTNRVFVNSPFMCNTPCGVTWQMSRPSRTDQTCSRATAAEDVVLHKLYWNKLTPSDRQLGDVAGVVAVQSGRLDEAYLRQWAARLGVGAEMEKALSGVLRPKHT